MTHPTIDFGQAADDYARHRPGFPTAFYERILGYGVGIPGQSVLDLGCGTGTLARGFAQRGCRCVGLDPSPEMLQQASILSREEKVSVAYIRACAEQTPFRNAQFDVACAGQCWHWFDRVRATAEIHRLLRTGGTVVLAYFTYLSDPGTIGHASEELVLRYNPGWPAAGSDGRFPMFVDELTARFQSIDTFEFDLDIPMTHAAWRGRMRACNGVILMPPEKAREFDAALRALLERQYPEPLRIPHRVYAIVGRAA